MLLAIAWRNIWRNKLRSIVIFAAIGIGIIGAVISDGYMSGLTDQRVNAAIANEVSDIQIHNPKFLINNEIQYLIPNAEKTKKVIQRLSLVKGVTLRLKIPAMASSANAGAGITLYGVNPTDEKKVSDIYKHIVKGKYLTDSEKIPTIIGKKLSKKLNLGIGDKLIITLTDTTGTITSGAFNIVGIYKTANDQFDGKTVFVNKRDLASLVGYPVHTGDEMAIRLKSDTDTPIMMKKLKKIFSSEIKQKKLIIQSWSQIQPLLKSMIQMMDYFSYIFLLIILLALAFAIVNTMLMAIMERTREIGMLMALGMNKRKIFVLILYETIFLSVIGAIAGLIISIFIVRFYSIHGFDLSSVAKGLNYIGYSSIIYFRVNTNFYFISILLVIIIAIISGIFPALKALRFQPATAVREDV